MGGGARQSLLIHRASAGDRRVSNGLSATGVGATALVIRKALMARTGSERPDQPVETMPGTGGRLVAGPAYPRVGLLRASTGTGKRYRASARYVQGHPGGTGVRSAWCPPRSGPATGPPRTRGASAANSTSGANSANLSISVSSRRPSSGISTGRSCRLTHAARNARWWKRSRAPAKIGRGPAY
jgi:hypothetical protein